MNPSLEHELADLSAALRVAIGSQYRPGTRLFAEPATYAYFRALTPLKKEAPPPQAAPPRPLAPTPPAAVTVKPPVAPPQTPPEVKTPEQKTPEEKKKVVSSEPFALHPPTPLLPDTFATVREQIKKIAPEVRLYETLPSDAIADEANRLAASPQVVIIAYNEESATQTFLQGMAEGISTKLGVTTIVAPDDPLVKDLAVRVFLITPAAAKADPELVERANIILLHQLPDLVAGDKAAKLKVWTALQGFLR